MNHEASDFDLPSGGDWDSDPTAQEIPAESATATVPAVANAPAQPAKAGNSDGLPTDLATAIRMWQDLGNVTDLHRRGRAAQRAHFELRRRVGKRLFDLQQPPPAPVMDAVALAESTSNARRTQTDIARRFLNASK